MRELVVIGNWKMHKVQSETEQYLNEFIPLVANSSARVLLAVPFLNIPIAKKMCGKNRIEIGAQNLHQNDQGAFTGEISASMLNDAGASFVLVGHSERRKLFNETDQIVKEKLSKALQKGLIPVFCFGESLEQRQAGLEKDVIQQQISIALDGLELDMLKKVILAYEPVWAIGTGNAASPEIAQNIHAECRDFLRKKYGSDLADNISILYGGSVNSSNIRSLINKDDIDGVLVGGASLDPVEFARIINYS